MRKHHTLISHLSIKNYALIEDIQVPLQSGMTIITGETGAGKSILLGALALLLGKRADMSNVKDPTKKCVIEAEFAINRYNLEAVFSENDLDYEAQTIVRREILPSGKSRAFVNDTPVTLQQLSVLGSYLVDIHSQNETLEFSKEEVQLEVIDALANTTNAMHVYRETLLSYTALQATIDALVQQKADAIKELDYHSFLHSELAEANLKGVNQVALEEEFETLNNAEAIQEALSQVNQLLASENVGTIESAKEVRTSLSALRMYRSEFDELWERVNSVIIELEDIESTTSEISEEIEANPQALFQLQATLQTIYKLQQKHAVATIDQLVAIETNLSEKINETHDLDAIIEAKETLLEAHKTTLNKQGETIHQNRLKAIPTLKKKMEAILAELGLPNAQFSFDLVLGADFRRTGMDTLSLLFTANKGTNLGSLKKTASGGEMSRIMLAVKAVLSQYKKLPTIIFDEIDTGVSGTIAHKMAGIMDAMSTSMQLLSITHLPQIAAKGTHHIKIYKEDGATSTVTKMQSLSNEERIVEIAQMIGGKNVSDAALANAKELLN